MRIQNFVFLAFCFVGAFADVGPFGCGYVDEDFSDLPDIDYSDRAPLARIFNGTYVAKLEFPWQIMLGGNGFCSGSIIDSDWILTAAHCVLDENKNNTPVDPKSLSITAGLLLAIFFGKYVTFGFW